MRQWLIVVLVACGGRSTTAEQPREAAGPSCAEIAVHAAPLFHGDEAATDRIAASVAGHCDVDQWSLPARSCVRNAANHDALSQCAYKHLTAEQTDKVGASLMPHLKPPPEVAVETEPAAAVSGGTQAEIAARSAEEGQALFAQGKFAEASSRYMDAVARVPEARYFYLLGQSKHREGKFGEALTACNAAEKNNPNAALAVKIRELRTAITNEAKAQGITL